MFHALPGRRRFSFSSPPLGCRAPCRIGSGRPATVSALQAQQHRQQQQAAPPPPQQQQQQRPPLPSFTQRRVQHTAAALKAAILDKIVEHRVFEGERLRGLLRGYLRLNAGEAFFPTLVTVVEELRVELGVA